MSEVEQHDAGSFVFTHARYRDLLGRLQTNGYTFRRFDGPPRSGDVLLRHDVDLSLEAAASMAAIEADLDVRSTYCILLSSPLYNPFDRDARAAIETIVDLGHDLALHFSTHAYRDDVGAPPKAIIPTLVDRERSALGALGYESDVVSFHRPPAWVLDRSFAGFTNTYAPDYFSDVAYLADSNQRWRDADPLRELPDAMQLLVHPGLWGRTDRSFEDRVHAAVAKACDHTAAHARMEFLGVDDV